jgi:phosphonopyruvate decarboxylase
MDRAESILKIMQKIDDEVVITSTGMISREVYRAKDRTRNFYMMGSMGYALAIGIGIAYTRPDLKVVVISGDGAVLMSLGTLALQKKLNLPNLKHYILDNNCHDTTGGQKTISDIVDFSAIGGEGVEVVKVERGQNDAPRIPLRPMEIRRRFMDAIVCKPKE